MLVSNNETFYLVYNYFILRKFNNAKRVGKKIFICSKAFVLFLIFFIRLSVDNMQGNLRNENMDLEELLIAVMYNTLRPFKCVTIICDEIYYEFFQGAFFKSIKIHVTFFIVNLPYYLPERN